MEEKVKIAVHVLTKDGSEGLVKKRYIAKVGEDGESVAWNYVELIAFTQDMSMETFYEEVSKAWANEIFGDRTLYQYWGMTIG